MASKTEKCSICKRSLGNDSKKELTTACYHKFHRECVEQRCKEKLNDCPKCDKISALKYALAKDNEATSKQRGSSASKPNKDVCLSFLVTRRDEDIWLCFFIFLIESEV